MLVKYYDKDSVDIELYLDAPFYIYYTLHYLALELCPKVINLFKIDLEIQD